jgi:hypothetical protein
MSTIYRKLFGGPDKPRPTSIAEQVRSATTRGREDIAATNRFLANNPASSANRHAASAAAQRRNQPAIDLLKAGACRAFNPIAQKQKA